MPRWQPWLMKFIQVGPDGTPESMQVAEGPAPVPRVGEILIQVRFAGINRPDILQRMGRYPPPADASPILGLEVAGTVAALGPGVTQFRTGDRVCALAPGGGYAQFCTVAAGHALPVTGAMSLEQAAAFPENWFTVWANLIDLAQMRRDERLLVHGGSSGIGLAAIQLARHVGAQAIVTAGSEEKCAACREFGAGLAINYRTEDFVARTREFTAGQGVDVILDMVGGPYIPKNVSLLRPQGRLVFIAFLQGNRSELDFTPVMVRRLHLTGSTLRPRSVAEKSAICAALLRDVWPLYGAGSLRSRIHETFAFEQVAEAHRLMESSRHIGKILLRVP
jgi:putative PIG3 family NAD(P)H quinone oxidoreductase